MRTRRTIITWVLAFVIAVTAAIDLSAQFRRKDIYDASFTAADRLLLRQLIIQWVSTDPSDPIQQHLDVIGSVASGGIHCNLTPFLTWHRQYIEQLETWLMTQPGGSKFVPLPKWNPTTQIPDEFFNDDVLPGHAVVSGYADLVEKDPSSLPGINVARFLNAATICNYTSGSRSRFCMGWGPFTSVGTAMDNFAWDLERAHNPVHINIDGVMNDGSSPAAAIFWLWHAFVDDAYQHYLCNCAGTYPNKDLFIKDNNADIGDEPNTTTGIYYLSPEIWVRQNPDVVVGGRYSLEDDPNRHENAEYKTTGSNYVYVRVRNKGCAATVTNEVRLRVYWSKAQTAGWVWPNDWTNTPPATPKRGDEITTTALYVPPLAPGETWVAQIPWTAPNPADYPTDSYHFCLLARLVSASDPMASIEGPNVGTNTRENNNVAWKNVQVKNDDPFNIVAPGDRLWNTVHVRATALQPRDIRVLFDFPKDHGVFATVDLGKDLYERWVAGGAVGTGITRLQGTQVRINTPGAYIGGLALSPERIYTIRTQAYVEYGDKYTGAVLNYGDRVNFNVMQLESYDDSRYTIAGGNNTEIRLKQSPATDCGRLITSAEIIRPSCPSATNGGINLQMPSGATYVYFWSNGARTQNLQNIAPGKYWVVVRSSKNCVERREFTVEDRSGLATTMTTTVPRCRQQNGSAEVSVTGGVTPYTYQWYLNGTAIQGATQKRLNNMGYGSYMVIVTDAGGCTISDHIKFTDDFMPLSLSFNVTDASSPNSADGAIDMTVVNGMEPMIVRWSNGQTIEDLTGIPPGTYSVTVIDMMGCTISGTVTVGVRSSNKNLGPMESPNADLTVLAVVPNPVKDLAEVQYTLRYSSPVRVELYDELGALITSYEQGVKSVGANSAWLETSGLPAGRYSCRLIFRGGVTAVPVVVVR